MHWFHALAYDEEESPWDEEATNQEGNEPQAVEPYPHASSPDARTEVEAGHGGGVPAAGAAGGEAGSERSRGDILIFMRMNQRIIKKDLPAWPQELAKAIQADEEDALTEIIEDKALPVILPIQQGSAFNELTSTVVEGLYETFGHPLITTPRGFDLLNEILTKRGRFRPCKLGVVAFDKSDPLFEVDKNLLDTLDPKDGGAFETLCLSLDKRGRDQEDNASGNKGHRAAVKPSPTPQYLFWA
jgi:hypothetical protein